MEQFKLSYQKRLDFQNSFKHNKNLPDIIKKNIITQTIDNIFKNILFRLVEINPTTVDEINNVFYNNNVYFEEEIDLKIPNKRGTIELQFYCLLNDIYFYFNNKKKTIDLETKFSKFMYLQPFIEKLSRFINPNDIILRANYLINILYMFLEAESLQHLIFRKIVKACLPFDRELANEVLKLIKRKFKITINNKEYDNDNIIINDGEETIIIIDRTQEYKKINTKAKYINWHLNDDFSDVFDSEYFTLCLTYPQNCDYNYFSMNDNIKNQVNFFFDKMIKSPPMKQAMIIDKEARKYKYFFSNDKILKEFENNVHLVVLPFQGFYGFTDKKSFDIYINILINSNNNFINTLIGFKFFFISKAHEFKHSSRIYLRLYNDKVKIKTQTKSLKNFKSESSYIKKLFENSKKNLINSIVLSEPNKLNEYGDLLEYSLFGYKSDIFFLKSIFFCLNESSWDLSPEDFYDKFDDSMKDKKEEKIDDLCQGFLLKSLLNYFNFQKKEKFYQNCLINKSSNLKTGKNPQIISVQRFSHQGLREINRSRKNQKEKEIKEEEETDEEEEKEEAREEEEEVEKEKEDVKGERRRR